MKKTEILNRLLETIKAETLPALGCTEPVAVAYAVAVAKDYMGASIDRIDIKTSKNIYKNGKAVVIPKTDQRGLDIAGALALVAGDSEKGLMVLEDVSKDDLKEAHSLIDQGRIRVSYFEESPDVFVQVEVWGKNKKLDLILRDSHNHIEEVRLDGQLVYQDSLVQAGAGDCVLDQLSIKELVDFAQGIDISKLDFIEEGIIMNKEAVERGLEEGRGMALGSNLMKIFAGNKLNINGPSTARIWTAAAADLRMGGGTCPIMTSGGSGNQGLGVILPIVAVAEEQEIGKEKLLRAVFLGHVINKYVKKFTGKLSHMCGCGIAAGLGASGGITWMLGGNIDQISGACNSMLANLTGMICDGAKETCALKLSTSAEEAVISAYLALENIMPAANIGLVGSSLEETIANIGRLCQAGHTTMEEAIISIIDC